MARYAVHWHRLWEFSPAPQIKHQVGGAANEGALPGGGTANGDVYQAVVVAASVMPSDSSQRSASMAALQPSAAAVTAWR